VVKVQLYAGERCNPTYRKMAQGVPHLKFSMDAGERYKGKRYGDGTVADLEGGRAGSAPRPPPLGD